MYVTRHDTELTFSGLQYKEDTLSNHSNILKGYYSKMSYLSLKGSSLTLCCLMTPNAEVSERSLSVMLLPHSFLCLQITDADIRNQVTWAVSPVIADASWVCAGMYVLIYSLYCP